MFKNILVPLDGSKLAEAALPAARALAAEFDSKITLVRVIPPPLLLAHTDNRAYADLLVTLRQQSREEAKTYLDIRKGSLRRQGFRARAEISESESPADAILSLAEKQGIDTVVMSTHGRGGLSRWVYGSVADKVLRHSQVPVLLIRAGEQSPDLEMPDDVSEADIYAQEPRPM